MESNRNNLLLGGGYWDNNQFSLGDLKKNKTLNPPWLHILLFPNRHFQVAGYPYINALVHYTSPNKA